MELAPDVESLCIENTFFDPASNPAVLLIPLQDIFRKMQRLKSLRLVGPLHSAILHVLPALGRITCLELENTCSSDDLQQICSTLSLSRLVLFEPEYEGAALVPEAMLAVLAAGNMTGLRQLVLSLPAAEAGHLSSLVPLTALTALTVRTRDARPDVGSLASLTRLKCLEIDACCEDSQPIYGSLSPLAALTRLTSLDLCDDVDMAEMESSLPSDVSVLSSLAALQVLRCGFFMTAEFVAGDPLPVQLRFLRSATGLEYLDLGFWGPFWSLPHASSLAIREAVGALMRLTQVMLTIKQWELSYESEQFYMPAGIFAAATSIESFDFWYDGPCPGPSSGLRSAKARTCFTALAKLQRLRLDAAHEPLPRCADLLASYSFGPPRQRRAGAAWAREADCAVWGSPMA